MSVAPISSGPAPLGPMDTAIWAGALGVSTSDPVAVGWVEAIHAASPRARLTVGVDVEPFAGSPVPVFIGAAAAPTALHVVPDPEPVEETVVEDEAPAAKPAHYETAFVKVMNRDLTMSKPEDAITLARMRHFIENGASDVCERIEDLEAGLGLGRVTIKKKFLPGGELADTIRLRHKEVGNEDGTTTLVPAYEWENGAGDACWRFDVLVAPRYKKKDDGSLLLVKGKKVLVDKTVDAFTRIPISLLFKDRDQTGGVWTAQDAFLRTTVWVVCMVRLWACGREEAAAKAGVVYEGTATSLGALTSMSRRVSSAGSVRDWHTAAERHGLITVTGPRDGSSKSIRLTHRFPVPIEERTCEKPRLRKDGTMTWAWADYS